MPEDLKTPQAPVIPDTPDADTSHEVNLDANDDQLSARIDQLLTDEPQPPAPPVVPDTPPVKPEPPQPAAPPAEPKLWAGKYKTPEDLQRAASEIARKLEIDEDAAASFIESTKAAPDKLETKYKQWETQLGKRSVPKPTTPPQAPAMFTQDQVQRGAAQLTLDQLRSSEMSQIVASLGLDLPTNWQQLDEFKRNLLQADRATYYEFNRQFETIGNKNLQLAQDYAKSVAEQSVHNQQIKTQDIQKIRDFLTENSLEALSDEEAELLSQEAMTSPFAMEKKSGVDYLRPDSIFQYWWFKNGFEIIRKASLAAKSTGRKEAVEDLSKLQSQAVQTASTTPIAPQNGEKPKVDYSDDRQVSGLDDDALDKALEDEGGFNPFPRLFRQKK